eukprot:TRINITY_DN6015_c0_g1_i1.p1 TRINITY_DN6015_c0_g1~~TRINITY_DN6015_c0_g1_i1.p1  ORF type:complete len:437 (+),score=95.42 TRINITY_DN6015_c0_g1_i1:524-1834(+)
MYTPTRLLYNNLLMSSSFAWAEGAVAAILAVSAALISKEANSAAGLGLYLSFSAGTLVSPVVVVRLGLKPSLVLGLVGFSLFAASFIVPKTGVVLTAACISGFLGSVLWTAQGGYYTTNALMHSKVSDNSSKTSIGIMASIFAGVFPLALTLCKLTSSFILQSSTPHPNTIIYVVYTATAVAATVAMGFVQAFEIPDNLRTGQGLVENIAVTLASLKDTKMLLMVPTNVAFGLATSYFPLVVTPLVSEVHGAHYVGYLYALSGLTSFVFAMPFAWLSNRDRYGRSTVMIVGGFAYVVVFAVSWLVRPTNTPSLAIIFMFYGIGNTVWQGTCMAVFSDYWHAAPLPAFANLKLHSGLASSFGYALFPHIASPVPEVLCLIFSVVGVLCYLATLLHVIPERVPVTGPDDSDMIQMSNLNLITHDIFAPPPPPEQDTLE